MSGHQHATIEDTVYFWFAANDTSGSGGDGASPLYDVREAGAAAGAIPLLSGTPTLLTHANYPGGCYEIAVAATDGNGFAADDAFAVFCTLLIDSQNPSGFVGSCTLTPLAKTSELGTPQTGDSYLGATAHANIINQYDGDGIVGDTFPGTQSQLSGLANVGSAVHRPAADYTLTTGTQSANTYTATEALDGTNHEHTDDTGVIDLYYEFNIGSGTPSSVRVTGYVTGLNDDLDIYGYDWVAAAWVQIGNIQGGALAANSVNSFDMFVDMVGSGGNLGVVWVGFYKASGLTTATLAVDQIFIAFSQGESGYVDGIEVDTNASNTGTVPGIDGIKGHPVSTWAAALTLSASTGIKQFRIIGGSSFTLTANSDNYYIYGQSYSIALGGQSIAAVYIFGGDVTGVGTGAGIVFEDCPIGNVSLPPCVMRHCFPYGTITNTGTGDWFINDPRSRVAGSAAIIFDFGAAIGNTNLNIRADSGGWQLESMGDTGTDVASIEGWGQIIEGTCTGGIVTVRGNFTTSGFTNLTLSDDARFTRSEVATASVDEWEAQSQANPSGFHVNLMEIDSNANIMRKLKEFVDANVLFSDTAQAGGASEITLAAGTSVTDDDLKDYAIYLNGGLGVGQFARIEGVIAATQVASIVTPINGWETNPNGTTTYIILSMGAILHISSIHQSALTEITTELDSNSILADWANGGRLDLILDAILADTNELQSDDIPGLIAALNDISTAEVLTQVNAALDTAIPELGVAQPTATPTTRTGLMLLYMALRNRIDTQTSGTDALEFYNNAGTMIAKKLLTDNGSDYSEAKITSG